MTAPVTYVLSERELDHRSDLLAVEGATTSAAADRIRRHVESMLGREKGTVIVDLSRVTFVDSSIVQALGDAAAVAKKRGARLLVVEPVDPNIARPLEIGRLDLVTEVLPTLDQAERAVELPRGTLEAAVPSAAPPPQAAPNRPRRTMFGRRQTDQEILRELGQLRRIAQELRREMAERDGHGPDVSADTADLEVQLQHALAEADRMEAEAEDAHARIQALERELAGARAEADRMEAEAEDAHARIQTLEAALETAREETAAVQRDLEDARDRSAAVQRDLEDARAEADRMEEEAEAAHARLQALEAENAELRAQLEQARADASVAAAAADARAVAERDEAARREAEAEAARIRADEEARRSQAEAARREAEAARIAAEGVERERIAAQRAERERSAAEEAARRPRPRVPVWADPTPINLNTADVDELMLLPGIGRRPAERILEVRASNGGFTKVDDLYEITEIPKDRITRIRPYVRV